MLGGVWLVMPRARIPNGGAADGMYSSCCTAIGPSAVYQHSPPPHFLFLWASPRLRSIHVALHMLINFTEFGAATVNVGLVACTV